MAVDPKAVASWGLLGEAGGSYTQVIDEMQIIVSDAAPLAVELEAESGAELLAVSLSTAEISVELRDGQ
jgi:hypothetical protein